MKTIVAVLALALATRANVVLGAEVTASSAFKSLQPFKQFARGAGEGVAYQYKPRTKAQFIALLRDKHLAKREMRVACNVLVRQMTEGHKALPFEGCEGAAAVIERDEFAVVACRDEMFQRDNWLAVTNKNGSAWGAWHRTCLPNEKVLVYKNEPLISLTCLNVAIPVAAPKPATSPVTAATPGCVEVHFTTKPVDSFVRIPIFASSDPGIAKDACTGVKRPGDTAFAPLLNEVCPRVPAWVCDFSRSERITGRKVVVMGSYATKPGNHVVRLPAYFASQSYITGFALIRGDDSYPTLVDRPTFLQAEEYGVKRRSWLVQHSTDVIGVRQFDYSPGGVAVIRYAQGDARTGEADLYFPPYGAYDEATR